jgi:hypothetical protein
VTKEDGDGEITSESGGGKTGGGSERQRLNGRMRRRDALPNVAIKFGGTEIVDPSRWTAMEKVLSRARKDCKDS